MRRLRQNLAVALGSLALCALAGELALRALDPPYFRDQSYTFHPRLGWTNRPGRLLYSFREDLARPPLLLEFNSSGVRDQEYPVQKPPRTKRIAFLGDSFVEAMQVDLSETFWKRTAAKLRALHPEFRWEALGFGVGNYGPLQEWMMLEERALPFRPDAVVLQIFPLNDIENSAIQFARVARNEDELRPYLVPDEKNGWRETYDPPLHSFWRRHSYLYRFGSLLLFPPLAGEDLRERILTRLRVRAVREGMSEHLDAGWSGLFLRMNVFAEPAEQFGFIREGWAVTDEVIRRFALRTRAMDVPLVVMLIPSEPELQRLARPELLQFGYRDDSDYPERRIRALLGPFPHATTLSLTGRFQAERKKVLPYTDGHLNVAAHEIAAEELTKALARALAPNRR